jgi:hypothetical protein
MRRDDAAFVLPPMEPPSAMRTRPFDATICGGAPPPIQLLFESNFGMLLLNAEYAKDYFSIVRQEIKRRETNFFLCARRNYHSTGG